MGYEASGTVFGAKRRTSSEENKRANEVNENSDNECIAVINKQIKYICSIVDYKAAMPYSAIMYSYDYSDKIMTNFKK